MSSQARRQPEGTTPHRTTIVSYRYPVSIPVLPYRYHTEGYISGMRSECIISAYERFLALKLQRDVPIPVRS